MFGKKKKKEDDFEIKEAKDPFEELMGPGFPDISKLMKSMMGEMQKNFANFPEMDEEMLKNVKPGKPMVYGFSMNIGPDGKVKMQNFGNVKPEEKEIRDEREPLIDVIEKERTITVLAEMPGVEKKDIKITMPDEKALVINVPHKFHKKITLPTAAKKNTPKAHYKNGVLEIELEKKKPSKPASTEIPVE